MRNRILLALCGFLLVIGTSCAPRQPGPEYRTNATIKEIMDLIVDRSADHIWQSVSTEVTLKGTFDHVPKTDEDWAEERSRALMLMEASNLLQMPDRKVAPPGSKAENPEIEETPEAIQELIDKDRASWIKYAHGLYDAAEALLKAAEARNAEGIEKGGEGLDKACENCHMNYWYPHQNEKAAKAAGSMKPVAPGSKAVENKEGEKK
ncbi:MAG: hypothetical protein ABL967_07585 [Bryobacteraceae bacterium]